MNFSFESFVNGEFDDDKNTSTHNCLWLRQENMDVGGGKITLADIDRLKDYPDIEAVTISGLRQDAFEYFIKTYGKQFKIMICLFLKICQSSRNFILLPISLRPSK